MTQAQLGGGGFPAFYDEQIETLPRSDLMGMQEGYLLQLVPYVYERSPLIREVWQAAGVKPEDIRSLEDFKAKAPFIDKDRIRRYRDDNNDPFGGIKCVDNQHISVVGFTSGTTGDPTPVPKPLKYEYHHLKRDFWHIGVRPGDYFCYLLFTFSDGHSPDRYTDCGFRPIPFQHSPAEIPQFIEASLRYRPKLVFTMSTPMVMALEEYQKETGVDLIDVFSSYGGAIFGGEAPPPKVKRLMESWGLEMYETTNVGDVIGGIDCHAHAGFHTWEDLVLIECLDPDGDTPVADGERGELVVTSLQDDAAPLVRYRTDDLVTFTTQPCICGRTHGRIKVLGRKGDELIIDGKSILPRNINPIVDCIPETESVLYQVIKTAREMDVLRIRIGYNPKALTRSLDELRDFLRSKIAAELEVPVEVELTVNDELLKLGPPHKIPRVTKQ